jgi:hypothetical protein
MYWVISSFFSATGEEQEVGGGVYLVLTLQRPAISLPF